MSLAPGQTDMAVDYLGFQGRPECTRPEHLQAGQVGRHSTIHTVGHPLPHIQWTPTKGPGCHV